MTELNTTKQTPETVQVDVPPEPPLGSVVIDTWGVAWQSRTLSEGGDRAVWTSAGPRQVFTFGMRPESGLTHWSLLITERQPLTIVHRAND